MSKRTDIRVIGVRLYFLPICTRMPLKFGTETVTLVTCARASVSVVDHAGRTAEGWGETPLSVQWVWPANLSYELRLARLKELCKKLAEAWVRFGESGHPVEIGYDFQMQILPGALNDANRHQTPRETPTGSAPRQANGSSNPDSDLHERGGEPIPWLAALLCCSVFDQAVHDAYGNLAERPVYETYCSEFTSRDLAQFIESARDTRSPFVGKHIRDYLLPRRLDHLPAWHLVGGLDPIDSADLTGSEPDDGYPVLLTDWILRDGLKCLKVKLRGNDSDWDYQRLAAVGQIAMKHGATQLSADFNCTVMDPRYVVEILDRLRIENPRVFAMLLYVEQPFPYDLEKHRIDVHALARIKPLFLDESAHDWRHVRLGHELGWTGVALKTCKTQTGALLSACWAKAHGMQLMVQDLTNPMLAQIPHLLLAAHVGTIMGVETNAMQFYPEASLPESRVHPGIYRRQKGMVDLSSVRGHGFGYQVPFIQRKLPAAAIRVEC